MLEKDLGMLSNSSIGQILQNLAEGNRDENANVDSSAAEKDAGDLIAVYVAEVVYLLYNFLRIVLPRPA